MSVLVENLMCWRGREHTEKLIEERGFAVHRIGQNELIDYCRAHAGGDEHGLGTYWTEVARELVCSARQIKVNQRAFPAYATYRSSYLDNLARRMAHTSSPFPDPPLHPCVRLRQLEYSGNGTLWQGLIRKTRGRKVAEIERLHISAEGWSGLKKDIRKILEKFAYAHKFVERSLPKRRALGLPSKAFCKVKGNGLIFGCGVDAGWLPQATQLHLNFFVIHEEECKMVLRLGDYRDIVPGFELYNYFMDDPPEFHVLGIRAYVELFDVFANSFE